MADAPSWVTLTDDETVVWTGRPVIYHYLGGLAVGVVLLALAGGAAVAWPFGTTVAGWIPAAVLAAVGVAVGGWTLIERWSISYLVTTREVYVKRGLVSRTVKNLRVEQIQNTSFSETLLGRLLSYGDVRIDTAGSEGPEVVLRNVADPEEVLGIVSNRTERP